MNNCTNEIKHEDKKALKSFAIIMFLSAICGAVLGFMSEYLDDTLSIAIPNLLSNIFKAITPFVSLTLTLFLTIISLILYKKSRKEYELYAETDEEEDTINKIEMKLSLILVSTSINQIIGFLFVGIGFSLLSFADISTTFDIIKLICLVLGFILCLASTISIQKRIVNFEKEMNPLLKGSVYDSKFTEKWVDSCDEAIKLNIYKSAYKAYSTVSMTCILLWMFCFLGNNIWHFGIMPMVMVTIIWLVQTISYGIASIKLSKIN